ncbi:hypothetical protein PPTG_18584 [Phytophthora nicotianae INRA-310]|uniref:MULE transposase domain-containing protein n=1 Tax=Phytophthora nicotianae (strain INRA-310) TaxID=761204 RepID=W2PEV3_PHYN3|nr:hypothetical protein PPTG_18584 [Phytophthora nicotianae INRA-310]ETM99361.1 hypothetical protein PPTG_18584 [Phytophthora nicotianae INRA-310]
MADGDNAQCNALAAVFGGHPAYRSLMGFFHVMKKVQYAIKCFPSGLAATLLRNVYNLHFARSESAYLEMLRSILKRWMEDSTLHVFAQYMYGQWITGHFGTRQVFAAPAGFASTNKPVETFNALLKRDYTG